MKVMVRRGDTIGWWGCLRCGETVRNSHSGPCTACGGDIGRIVPKGVPLDMPLMTRPVHVPVPIPQIKETGPWSFMAVVAAAVLCIGSPLLGASGAGWNAVATVMALNIWSSSIGYYALAFVRNNAQEATHA